MSVGVTVTVTPEDVAAGVRGDPEWCPVARALHDLWPHLLVQVDDSIGMQDWDNGTDYQFPLPPHVAEWIEAFDDGDAPYPPPQFTLAVPDELAPPPDRVPVPGQVELPL